MGTLGAAARIAGGPPDINTISRVKNPTIAGYNNQLLGEFGTASAGQNAALGDYITRYMANQPAAEKATGEEVGAIGQFYNGAMSNQLAQLRAQRGKAMTDAATLASQQALGSLNRSRVASQGGTGSYNARLAQGALVPIQVQSALDNANQARSDLGYITQNQIGLTGQRNALNAQQAAASSGLAPQEARMAALGRETGVLSGMGNVDQQNTFYGLQQKPNEAADYLDAIAGGVTNMAAIYGSVGGGMGGMKRGGLVRGPGTGTSDSIPIRVSRGEYVLPAEVVHMTGVLPLLERVRKIALKHREERQQFHHHITGIAPRETQPKGMKRGGAVPVRMPTDIAMARGGLVRGYQDGGMVDLGGDFSGISGDLAAGNDNYSYQNLGGGGGGSQKKGGGGGGGGGLSGTAQMLLKSAVADLSPTWERPVMNTTAGAAPSGAGLQRPPPQAAPLPPSSTPNLQPGQSRYFTPQNYNEIPSDWQRWASETAEYYNNPKSKGYIPPGSYE